jgi:hypothetical protein
MLPSLRHIRDLDVLVPLLGQRRAADVAADGPGSRGPELFKQFLDNESFRRWMTDTVFGLTYGDKGTPYA